MNFKSCSHELSIFFPYAWKTAETVIQKNLQSVDQIDVRMGYKMKIICIFRWNCRRWNGVVLSKIFTTFVNLAVAIVFKLYTYYLYPKILAVSPFSCSRRKVFSLNEHDFLEWKELIKYSYFIAVLWEFSNFFTSNFYEEI